jgi:DeoR/GlpR family transcriptional regulator of sugar metabolism
MDRDEELDQAEEELREAEEKARRNAAPFIERPDSIDLRDGTTCWLDGSRVCGPDCTAFNTNEMDEQGIVSDGPNKCLLLVYQGQMGSAALAQVVTLKKKMADEVRKERNNAAPPNPYGGDR